MASKLCCITEDERAGSPELPNVRLSRTIPAKQPFITADTTPSKSHLTNDCHEDVYELRNIFHNDRHLDDNRPTPMRSVRARFSRPSLQSIRSLHKVESIRSIIKKKLPRDFHKKQSSSSIQHTPSRDNSPRTPPNTVIKQQKRASRHQLQITKEVLQNDLLTHKVPNQGSYDPDAQVLDDVARNIGRKSPGKRPSIRSIDWATTPASKSTPESSQGRISTDPERDVHLYDIYKTPAVPLSKKFSHVSSTPNLRPHTSICRGRKLRRSHSPESTGLPKPLALSPLHIPSLVNNNTTTEAWSESLNDGLCLSRFPVPPRDNNQPQYDQAHDQQEESHAREVSRPASNVATASVNCSVEIRVQQPTLSATSRASTARRDTPDEISPSATVVHFERSHCGDHDNGSHHSFHLHSMRISHHLRSGSLLSWDKLGSGPEIADPPGAFGEHSTTDSSRISKENQQRSRYDRQKSSSGISSSKIPARWGKVVPSDTITSTDPASSTYSNKPQGLLGSLRGSVGDLLSADDENRYSRTSSYTQKLVRSATFPTDNGEMAVPTEQHEIATRVISGSHSGRTLLHAPPTLPSERKNSVAGTKVSKFREEFSPPAPKKKLTQSSSIIRFLNPKRLALGSQGDTSLRSEAPIANVDGPSDVLDVPTDLEGRHSQSLMSLRTEQQALGKSKGADQVWDRALKAHQEEKASLFLPKNKDLAVHGSPFRQRSGSVSTKRVSVDDHDIPIALEGSSRHQSTPRSHAPNDERGGEPPIVMLRRRALTISDESEPGQALANAYERQGDGKDVVGAWGRYPSHTRHDRVGSAGKPDGVRPRDFALEAAIAFALPKDEEDMIGPTQRRPSTPLLPGEKKKKKKRIGGGRMMRSSSMTFGRALMKNYGKMFKSQSTEFRRHGRGHRSSIASGGILEHPELELLPEVWAGNLTGNASSILLNGRNESATQDYASGSGAKGKGRLVADDLMATLRPRRNSSAPNIAEFSIHAGAAESEHTPDSARIWSVYYKNCVDTYPRLSTDGDISAEDFKALTGSSLAKNQVSRQSSMMLGHCRGHSRNTSIMSHTSQVNKCLSSDGDDCAAEVKSLVSVRRSTMDLISQLQEQEANEHERILSLGRG